MTHKLIVWIIMSIFLVQIVSAIGFAPVVIQGEVYIGDIPVEGAFISAEAIDEFGEVLFSSEVLRTDENGFFVFVLTIPHPVSADVVLSLEAAELYTQTLENVLGWEEYKLVIDISDGLFISPTVREILPPVADEFDEIIKRLQDGVVDEDLMTEYNIIIEEAPIPGPDPIKYIPPVEETPDFVAAPKEKGLSWVPPISWQWWTLVGIVLCLLFFSYELSRHRKHVIGVNAPEAPRKPMF